MPAEKCFNQFCPYVLAITTSVSSSSLQKVKLRDNTKVVFCEYCIEAYKRNQKCDYCQQVYFDSADDADMDGKKWIECSRCKKWSHTDCEVDRATTTDSDMRTVAAHVARQLNRPQEEQDEGEASEDELAFWCIVCRKQKGVKTQRAQQMRKHRKTQADSQLSAVPSGQDLDSSASNFNIELDRSSEQPSAAKEHSAA